MLIQKLSLSQFRCYEKAEIEFSPGLNIIHGDNALGKTSILEALYSLVIGRSFRTNNFEESIKKGSSNFSVCASFIKDEVEQELKIHATAKEKRFLYNSTICPGRATLLGILKGVLITSNDIALIRGAPTIRRQFIDLLIAQSDPLYIHHSTRYVRAMKQRNALLRAGTVASLASWEQEMAMSAAYIVQERHKALHEINNYSQHIYTQISDAVETLAVSYKGPVQQDNLMSYYLEQWHKHRHREMALGYTVVGPHKDDLIIQLNHFDARQFASEGQQRSCAIALSLGAWRRLNTKSGETPLMLIDDFGVSLDSKRRDRLLEQLFGLGQVFLTCTEPNNITRANLIDVFSISQDMNIPKRPSDSLSH